MPDWTYDTQIELTDTGRTALHGNPTSPALPIEEEPKVCSACGGDLPDECYCGYDYSPAYNAFGIHSAI